MDAGEVELLAAWIVVVGGCAKAPPPLPPPYEAPPLPTGWWSTKDYAAHFEPDGYFLVGEDGVRDQRVCTWTWRGNHWSCPERPSDVLVPHGDDLYYGVDIDTVRLKPVDDPAPYEAALQGLATPDTACARAVACCAAIPELGWPCERFEQATSTFVCWSGMDLIRSQAADRGLSAPECER